MKINKNIAISDNGFVFNPNTGESFSVNQLGVDIINLLKNDESLDKITEEIINKYTVDEATAEKDLSDFISLLQHHSLIEANEKK
ncbi:MAG: PqqD family protein [Bacteroidota bacterium]